MAFTVRYTFVNATPGKIIHGQLVDDAGSNVGAPITTASREVGDGVYAWKHDLADNTVGWIDFCYSDTPGTIIASIATSPQEFEWIDARISSVTDAITLLNNLSDTQIVNAIKAYEVETGHSFNVVMQRLYAAIRGNSEADDATNPTALDYFAPDGTTVRVHHALTDTTRTAS